MSRAALLLFAIVLSSACATAPRTYPVQKTQTIDASFDQVWAGLMHWFVSGQAQLKTVEKQSGVITAERANDTGQQFADCGTPGIATVVARPISLHVLVQPVSSSKTTVTVNVGAEEKRELDGRPFQVRCNSTGALERQLLSAAAIAGFSQRYR